MELEFDKEIDAILRKARPNRGVLVGDDPPAKPDSSKPKQHIDADAVAAFVENALPEKTKRLYMEHFADCDSCRKSLSFAMQMNAEADASEKSAAPVVTPAAEKIIPWYQNIFRAPNIAFTMGALVLAFSGVLGYLVLQNQKGESNATVSQVKELEQQRGGPNLSGEDASVMPTPTNAPMSSANTAASANTMANAANMLRGDEPIERLDSAKTAKPAAENNFQLDGASGAVGAPEPKSVAAAPPAATDSTAGASLAHDEKKADDEALKENDKDTAFAKRKAETRSLMRDAPPPPAKSGPVRSGPLQNQSNQSNAGQMSVTRTVGGKTFSNRDGAWYDSAYNGQATLNYRRGTSEYKKLDSGLRNIADTLGGTVVVVWKAKAYRIQ